MEQRVETVGVQRHQRVSSHIQILEAFGTPVVVATAMLVELEAVPMAAAWTTEEGAAEGPQALLAVHIQE